MKRTVAGERVSFDEALVVSDESSVDLIALDEALTRLGALDPRKVQVVEMRFFGGLSLEDAAEVLGVSTDTVGRDWNVAKAWLLRELTRA